MHPLANPIRLVTSNLESLRDFVEVLDTFLVAQQRKSIQGKDSFLIPLLVALDEARRLPGSSRPQALPLDTPEKLKQKYPLLGHITAEVAEPSGFTITIPGKQAPAIQATLRDIRDGQKRTQMLYSSALLSLTSSVELFFARLLHEFFSLQPDAIGTKDKVFSFGDLSRFDSIADARTHYVLDKIENLLRGSLADWFKFARDELKLSMGYAKDDLSALEETFQRRNLIVHNGGIVNSIYISRVSIETRGDIKLGDDVSPTRSYLNQKIDLWERTCLLIAAELWKRLAPGDEARATLLGEISYRHLESARWPISAAISEFLVRDKGMQEAVHLTAKLNLWQSRKHMGEWSSIEKEIAEFDTGAKSSRYQLPLLALQANADAFFEALPNALKSGELSRQEVKEWPIFADMRDDPRFAAAISRRRRTPANPAPVRRTNSK